MSIITPSRLWRGVGRDGSAAAAQSSSISRRDRDLGDLGRSRAICRTWTRCGLRELMSIITPSRFWRGVGREGSAAAAYSPSSLGEIAISAISGDLERDVGQRSRSRGSSDGVTLGPEVWHGAYLDRASFGKQHRCLFRKASTAASFGKQQRCLFRKADGCQRNGSLGGGMARSA